VTSWTEVPSRLTVAALTPYNPGERLRSAFVGGQITDHAAFRNIWPHAARCNIDHLQSNSGTNPYPRSPPSAVTDSLTNGDRFTGRAGSQRWCRDH